MVLQLGLISMLPQVETKWHRTLRPWNRACKSPEFSAVSGFGKDLTSSLETTSVYWKAGQSDYWKPLPIYWMRRQQMSHTNTSASPIKTWCCFLTWCGLLLRANIRARHVVDVVLLSGNQCLRKKFCSKWNEVLFAALAHGQANKPKLHSWWHHIEAETLKT